MVIIAIYWRIWFHYLNDRGQRELHQQVFWESFIYKELRQQLPEYMRAPGTYATAYDTSPEGVSDKKPELRKALHESAWVQILVAICFALLFVGALGSRAAYGLRATESAPESRVTIEGNAIEIDSLSKVKAK
jgi:hypothetical protein